MNYPYKAFKGDVCDLRIGDAVFSRSVTEDTVIQSAADMLRFVLRIDDYNELWTAAEDVLIHFAMGWEVEDVLVALRKAYDAIPRPN